MNEPIQNPQSAQPPVVPPSVESEGVIESGRQASHPEHSHSGHGHGHHHHGHGHLGHTDLGNARRLATVFVLIALYTVAEAVGGWWTGSLALLADASHMLSDVAALGIALLAIWLSRRPATRTQTFGFYRAEVLGALVNGLLLIAISGVIVREAFHRLEHPGEILAPGMLAVASGGLVVNLVGLSLLHGGHDHSLNVRGAWLHMIADTLGSIGAMVGAGLIWRYGWSWADPAVSALIAVLVFGSAIGLLRETVRVLMEGAPSRFDLGEVEEALLAVDGVLAVHDLHAWTIGSHREALTVHVVHGQLEGRQLLAELRQLLHDRFNLEHVTLQLETESTEDACAESHCLFDGGKAPAS